MAGLTSAKPSDSYKSLLRINDNTYGVDDTLEVVEDGEGTNSCLKLSTKQFLVKSDIDIDATFDVQNSSSEQLLTIDTVSSPEEVIINEGGLATIDFRVESDGEDEALFLDASTNTLYINKGDTAFSTIIGTLNSSGFEGLSVTSAGVIINEDGHAAGDFRVEGDTDSNLLFCNAGTDKIGIGTNAPTAYHADSIALHIHESGTDANDHSCLHLTTGDSGATLGDGTILMHTASNQTALINKENTDMIFYTNNALRMTIDGSGNVGVGTTAPGNPLAVNRSGDGVIVDFESADAVEGTVSISGSTTSYNAFVGSHYTQLKDGQNDLPIGAVVISTGEIITCNLVTESIEAKDAILDEDGNIEKEAIDAVAAANTNIPNKEYFTYINTTTTASNSSVYGVWMGKMSDNAKGHSFGNDDNPIYLVAQVGLFKIRVTDTNGNISNGDFLESSTRAMEGQKQTTTAKVNSTIGKAMIDVDWSTVETDTDLGYKWKLIPCTF